jgi:hypothetical protein
MWAVSLNLASNKGTVTKSQKVKIGSLGILYCSMTQEFTTPFLTTSIPEPCIVKDVWPEEWGLPFEISTLGSPKKRLAIQTLSAELPSVNRFGKKWNQLLRVQPTFSFQPMEISTDDWAYLFERLRN